jgi:hypothetical protein
MARMAFSGPAGDLVHRAVMIRSQRANRRSLSGGGLAKVQ